MRVFVVEDSPIVRDRLVAMLWDIPAVEVVGEADNQADAVTHIQRLCPDVVVLDIKLRQGTGIGVLEDVKRRAPQTTAIMLTNYANPEFRQRCVSLGADHFFDKTVEFEKVKEILEKLVASQAAGC
ncbi:MAG: response regulator transcription factor [Pseudomonadota bacterium]